jgi:outer membrane protein TolC
MVRSSLLVILFISLFHFSDAQRLLTRAEAIALASRNPAFTSPAQLGLARQQQLARGASQLDNPELEYEIDPYDPTVLGVLMPLRLPSVYKNRKSLQGERVRLSELLLRLNSADISRLVQNTYNEMQFLSARLTLLRQQDSLYQSVKVAAQRNFQAGQINKLEELFAVNEANNINNELNQTTIEYAAQKRAMAYILNLTTDYVVDTLAPIRTDSIYTTLTDTLPVNVQQEILRQQVAISRGELQVEKSELLPQVTTGPLFGLQAPHGEGTKRLGVRVGVSLPLWFGQNRSRIRAAELGVQLAEAERTRELQAYRQEYQTVVGQVAGRYRSVNYYATTASVQANEIISTAFRLFGAGQLSYIETLRNMITAYATKADYLQAIRDYNQAVIQLNYLKGTL